MYLRVRCLDVCVIYEENSSKIIILKERRKKPNQTLKILKKLKIHREHKNKKEKDLNENQQYAKHNTENQRLKKKIRGKKVVILNPPERYADYAPCNYTVTTWKQDMDH